MVNNARFKGDMSCSMVDNTRPESYLLYPGMYLLSRLQAFREFLEIYLFISF